MGQGLLIDYQDGHSPIEIQANIRAPSFCRSIPFSTGGDTVTIDEYVSGSKIIVIPRNCLQIAAQMNGTTAYRVLNHVFVQNDKEVVYRTWASNQGGHQNFKAVWDSTIWQILPISNTGSGLLIANSTDMTTITDASRVGSCVFAGSVHINGDWRIPDVGGVDRNTHVCFARWSADGVTLTFDGQTVYARNEHGSNVEVDVNIAVFAKAPIEAPPGHGGLAIWNGSNNLTFSTYRRPFLWDGFMLPLKDDWQDIGNRMVSLGVYGITARNDGYHEYGFQMNGNNVRLSPGRGGGGHSGVPDFDEWMSGEVPCITNIL